MKRILLVFGTRPEAIKMAPVVNKLKEYSEHFTTIVCVTAQHREMLDQVLSIFNITPDYDLNIMQNNQNLFDITTKVLNGLKGVFEEAKPDLVMVQGDTTTAFVAGLGAFYLKIPVGHVEAGLRTYDKYSPFPEEKNRHLLSTLTDYHFAPTEWSKSNLIKENVPLERIWVTGNTVIDALMTVVRRQKSEDSQGSEVRGQKSEVRSQKTRVKAQNSVFFNSKLRTQHSKLILVTGHRRESFGEGFENICQALKAIARERKDVMIVYPVHLNPNVQRPVKAILKGIDNVFLIEPLEYEPFIFLMNESYLILTDSGGIQEEAPSLGKPVLVMRNTTERPEGIEAGVVKLVGTEKEDIIRNTMELLDNQMLYEKMSQSANPYGDGRASEKIVDILSSVL
ncbi:MAG: UDP-N-acetylglucosamine 2-epimerase (non-hydrolyzing) [Proteobacteria bacterium]|nr:UDP-N-acetylglucosamine 2-epimerase (non-hydrolyzing) [Pseudomonadota bacterium]